MQGGKKLGNRLRSTKPMPSNSNSQLQITLGRPESVMYSTLHLLILTATYLQLCYILLVRKTFQSSIWERHKTGLLEREIQLTHTIPIHVVICNAGKALDVDSNSIPDTG